jgi:hypothetical protein
MTKEPDFGSSLLDTFADLGDTSYGTAIDDYQSQMDDFDLRGPNAQYLPTVGGAGEGGEEGCNDDLKQCISQLNGLEEEIEDLEAAVAELEEELTGAAIDNCQSKDGSKQMLTTVLIAGGSTGNNLPKANGYYQVVNGGAAYPQPDPTLFHVPVSAQWIIYENGNGDLKYWSKGSSISSNAYYYFKNSATGTIVAGPWRARQSDTHQGSVGSPNLPGQQTFGTGLIMCCYNFLRQDLQDCGGGGTFPFPGVQDECLFTVNYVASAGGTISGVSTENIKAGSNGSTVTAIPSLGQQFNGWSNGSTDATLRLTNVSEGATITANFGPIQA